MRTIKINSKIAIYFTSIVVSCILLSFYIWSTHRDITLITVIILFYAVIIGLSAIFVFLLKKHMQHILNKLSKSISNIIDMKEQEVFSVLNDDMLSKIQSQLIKLTNILKAQNKRIKKESDEIKSLISDIAHQLKTPLSNLKLYYELLEDTSICIEEHEAFSCNMKNQIEKLSFLLDSMIKMSRLEGGIIKLNLKKTNLNDVCLTVIKQVYQKAKSKNIQIKFNSRDDIILNIDKNWTMEAIFNIIDNSVKYTGFGGTIVIDVLKYEMFARVDITDNGIGIEEKEINSIFKRFYRGEDIQNEEGVGLGLYLARKIISKQNGYIKVKSKKLHRSTFSVFLPLN